jgi:AraC family transcriptional regulator, positive regulator of tynA and feaB
MTSSRGKKDVVARRVSSALASDMFFEVEVEGASLHTLADFNRTDLGDLSFLLAHHEGGGFRSTRPDYLIEESGVRDLYVVLVLTGTVTIFQEGRRADVSRGYMALIDPGTNYSIQLSESGHVMWIRFPRAPIEDRVLSIGDCVGRLIPCDTGIPYVAVRAFLASAKGAPDIDPLYATHLAASCVEMLALVLKTVFDQGKDHISPNADARFKRLEHYIEASLFDERLNLEMIAKHMDISVRYVSKLFRSRGTTANQYILKRRIHHCRQMLTDPRESQKAIKEIAYGCGFSSLSNFSRVFRQICGCTPGEYRAQGKR